MFEKKTTYLKEVIKGYIVVEFNKVGLGALSQYSALCRGNNAPTASVFLEDLRFGSHYESY